MSYLFDLHVHTAESSGCGQVPGGDMIRCYHQRGYAGVVITDHLVGGYVNGKCAHTTATDWQGKVDGLIKGYAEARKVGDELGMVVLFGWEYRTKYAAGMADLLTYGLDAEFLLANPQLDGMEGDEYVDFVQSSGGLVSFAHPYRHMPQDYVPPHTNVAAVEVLNACHHTEKYPGGFDLLALAFASKHDMLPLAGCDAHHLHEVDGTGMLFDTRPTNNNELLAAIHKGQYKLILQGKEWDMTRQT
ncbi:MAG: hypothetical protein FWB93_01400 [Oscillospiraceae bacterium]|nr:hypothetical protein [Oscillospiraceae bacterium]